MAQLALITALIETNNEDEVAWNFVSMTFNQKEKEQRIKLAFGTSKNVFSKLKMPSFPNHRKKKMSKRLSFNCYKSGKEVPVVRNCPSVENKTPRRVLRDIRAKPF